MAVDPVGGPGAVAGGGAARHTGAVVPRPVLMGRLGGPARVTVVSGAAGSGKTVLLRSWIGGADLAGHAAWVDAGRYVRDPQSFWLSVVGALRGTGPGSELVRAVSAAPDLDGWALVERLLDDLAPLEERLWLVVDDVHELDADQALRQLELLLMRAPPALRFVLATRHDVRLGLHRLRLEGELAEIRAGDLRFSLAEAGELFAAAGVELPGPAVAVLHERTEGWAAGLRLAALAAASHPDPERFAAGFSGTERTVAEYLLAEVLERQGDRMRRLLLRTSILDRLNGELADLLTGDEGAERALQDLEAANAFGQLLDGLSEADRDHPEIRIAAAELRLAEDDPGAALSELTRVLDGPLPVILGFRVVTAYALEAVARDGLGDRDAAERALERALDLAEPDEVLTPFLLSPVQALLERHAPHRTAHASLIAEIRSLYAGVGLVPRPPGPGPSSAPAPWDCSHPAARARPCRPAPHRPEAHRVEVRLRGEVVAFVEVREQSGVLGLPSESLAGQGAGGGAVEQGEGGHPGEVGLRLLGGDGGDREVQVLADDGGDVAERDGLVGDCVQPRAGGVSSSASRNRCAASGRCTAHHRLDPSPG